MDEERKGVADREGEAGAPNYTEIEIAGGPEGSGADKSDSPYRSLLVPLVVVPALIVMVLVLILSFFRFLSSEESSPADNLAVLISGGINEREQAAFGLVRQILEYQHARAEGREPEWNIDASFLEQVRTARSGILPPGAPREVWVPFVLSSLMAQFGDSQGVQELVETIQLGDRLDPGFEFRTNAIFILGSIGHDLEGPDRERVAQAMCDLVAGEDEGLAWLAAGALQNLPGSRTNETLAGLLGSRRADMRLQAALSLAELGDDAGAETLVEMLDEGVYLRERELDARRWAPQSVSISRGKALTALAEIGRLPSREELEALAEGDSDPNFRSKILELTVGAASPGVD